MCDDIKLMLPEHNIYIYPGSRIKIHRFSTQTWIVNYGWFSFDDNRELCGWYMVDCKTNIIKPLFKCDLHDCYLID